MMKFSALLSVLATAVAVEAGPLPAVGPAGNIIVPGGIAPEVQQLKATRFSGAQRVKIRYGPYTIPSITENNLVSLLRGERGVLSTIAVNLKKPCSNCGIMEMQAGLEYANGTLATVDTNAWLHHTVIMVSGQGRTDLTCPTGPLALFGERIFASGNERTPISFSDPSNQQFKTLFPLKSTDNINMQLELMNMDAVPKNTYFTLEYEYLATIPTSGWMQTRAVWLDITTCGDSNVYPPAGQQQFKTSMTPWRSTIDGQMFFAMGHLHDGGTNLNVYRNGQVVCTSTAKYSVSGTTTAVANAETIPHSHGRRDGPHNDSMPHIADMSVCQTITPLKKGDQLFIDANYDFDANMGMMGDRGLTPVMGIANVFVAIPM